MNSRQKLHQAQMKEWATRFADQKASGLTVKEWCDQNHFSIHRYHYWKRLLKDEIVDQVLPSPDIVPILLPTTPSRYQPILQVVRLTQVVQVARPQKSS